MGTVLVTALQNSLDLSLKDTFSSEETEGAAASVCSVPEGWGQLWSFCLLAGLLGQVAQLL